MGGGDTAKDNDLAAVEREVLRLTWALSVAGSLGSPRLKAKLPNLTLKNTPGVQMALLLDKGVAAGRLGKLGEAALQRVFSALLAHSGHRTCLKHKTYFPGR